jgi:hypothetical protein
MAGGGTTSSTSSTAPANPAVTSTLNSLLGSGGGVQGIFARGPQVFNQSTYSPAGSTTQNAWQSSLGAANNPAYASGVSSALTDNNALLNNGGLNASQTGNLNDTNSLANQYKAMALNPASTQAGQNLINDVTTSTNGAFNNSGLFGSDSDQSALSRGLTQGLGDLQQSYLSGQGNALNSAFGMGQTGTTNQQNAAQMLPGLFQAGQAPAAAAGAIGTAQDTNQQGILSGQADLYNRQNNSQLQLLQQLFGALGTGAQVGGSTTTNTQPSTPWWQSLAGVGLGLL